MDRSGMGCVQAKSVRTTGWCGHGISLNLERGLAQIQPRPCTEEMKMASANK